VLSHRHVLKLSKLDNPKVHHHLVESQDMLINAARDCDFTDFVNVLIYWLNAADPDGEEPREQPTRSGCTYHKHADGSVSGKFWFDPESKAVDVAVNTRSFPPWMKHVLLVRARGRCQIPGCDTPFPWLQADHVKPYSRGGPTKLTNSQILCDPHNKWKRDS